MIVIDKLCYNSRLRHVNVGEKFFFSMTTLLICVVSRSLLIACIVLLTTGILSVKKGGIPFFRYRRLLFLPLSFLLLSTFTIILNVSKAPLDAFAIPLGNYYITGSYASLYFALQLMLTALAAVSCLYFLSLSTPMTDILQLLRWLRCPALIVELMLLIYRFIFVLLDIATAITTSQHSRLGNKDFKTSLHSFGTLGSTLFIRAMKKANALFDSMESRCYDGVLQVLEERNPSKKNEMMWIVIFELCLIAIYVIERTRLWKILF